MSFWNLTVARAVIACQLSLCLFWVVISVNFSKGMPIPICWTYHFRISNFPCYFSVWNKLMREQINNFLPWRKVELEKWGRVAGKVYSIQPTKNKAVGKVGARLTYLNNTNVITNKRSHWANIPMNCSIFLLPLLQRLQQQKFCECREEAN